MKNVLIAFFSQTGTTSAVAERIATGLRKAGCSVTLFKIGRTKPPDLAPFDTIGIGSPTYVFRPPFVVTDFLRSLPTLAGKRSFVFVLHGTDRGACGNRIRKLLAGKSATDLGYFHCRGADINYGYLKLGHLFSPDSPTAKELEAAERFGTELPRRALGTTPTEPLDPMTHFLFAVERILNSRFLMKLAWSRTFHADGRCNHCGICIDSCPTGNIKRREGSSPQWGKECLLCVTCELRCPQDAIHSVFDGWLATALMTYNIRKGVRDRIPFALVTHSGGTTTRR